MSDERSHINETREDSALTIVPGEGTNTVVPIAPEAGSTTLQEAVYDQHGNLIQVRDIQS